MLPDPDELTASAVSAASDGTASTLNAAETARFARRISLSRGDCKPRDDFFFRTLLFLEAILLKPAVLETFFSLAFARLLFGCQTPH